MICQLDPEKNMVFPQLVGHIEGFGKQKKRFEQYQQHHIKSKDDNKEYDITIYSIVKYFQLCMDNNPNMVDSLFVPRRCVLYTTAIGEHVRENRKLFLHKGCFHKFKGYAYSQINKLKNKNIQNFIIQDMIKKTYIFNKKLITKENTKKQNARTKH